MDEIHRWTVSSDKYFEAAANNVVDLIKKKPNYKFDNNQKTPMTNYVPELDGTEQSDLDEFTLFQELIGVLPLAT